MQLKLHYDFFSRLIADFADREQRFRSMVSAHFTRWWARISGDGERALRPMW
jgi:hypothetical protein